MAGNSLDKNEPSWAGTEFPTPKPGDPLTERDMRSATAASDDVGIVNPMTGIGVATGANACIPSTARDTADAERWRYAVEHHDFPSRHRQLHPEEKILGWQCPSQNPPDGKPFNVDDFPYYDTAEQAIDAARSTSSAIEERTK